MRTPSLARALVTASVLAGSVGAVALADAASSTPSVQAAAAPKITAAGVGGVKLHKRYSTLRRRHLVGRIRMGCELAGPTARSSPLRAPLKGSVDYTMTSPRKVADIAVNGGASARGVGIGALIADIKAAFPKAKTDHSTDGTFELTLVRIPKSGGGRLVFGVSTKTHKVTIIGIPFIAFCE